LSQQGGAAVSLQWPATATLDLPFDTPAESWLALHCDSSDARALERLAILAHDYTPRVSHEESDAVLLEVRGSFRLFGGAHALCRQILERSLQLSLHISWALAPTPLAALALARARQNVIVASRERLVGLLSPLPVAVLRWPEATIERLESIGVRTLGALLRLPRAGFAQRFGQPALQMLDRLTGTVVDLRRPHRLRERFCVRGEPSFELQTDTVLLQHLTPLLAELERFLCLRQAGIEALQLRLRHRPPSADTRLTLRFAAAQWQADACRELLALQLSRKRLPAPVVAYELRSGAIRPRVTCSASLWRGNEQGAGVAAEVPALIERLRARLGDESVYGLCLVPEHRPERAWRIAEPHAPAKPGSVGATYNNTTRRPLWLLQQPRALPCALSQLQLLEGPERIETGWWDGGEVARDYYIACNRDGSRLWIYRERSAPHAWYWHGVFA
jgi:protein ImuB